MLVLVLVLVAAAAIVKMAVVVVVRVPAAVSTCWNFDERAEWGQQEQQRRFLLLHQVLFKQADSFPVCALHLGMAQKYEAAVPVAKLQHDVPSESCKRQ